MKKKLFILNALILTSLFSILCIACSAHYLWTETPGLATMGKEHQVHLYFGEINFNKYEVTGGRLDEMDGLKTICVGPDNKVKNLPLTKGRELFSGSFTPEESGIYQILTTHEIGKVMDLRKANLGIVKPMYYAREIVYCPDKENTDNLKTAALTPCFTLDLIPDFSNSTLNSFSVNQPVNFYSFFRKTPVKGGKIFAYAPNGWSKEIDPNVNGLCSFVPLWEGQYVIDWVYTENSPGTYMGKNFDSVRHRAVLTITVIK
ncbi:MAG: hypothetical protein IT242_00795 [Bacteroidia bacterium]|nr:hypothetical protein [Bacteroidia bacterium]